MSWQIAREEFRSLSELINVLDKRPNNKIMMNQTSSQNKDGGGSWYGTSTYKEAVKLMYDGYTDAINNMKKHISEAIKINSDTFSSVNHPMPHNNVYGYIPNVPNAIRGIPLSMINIDRKPMKRKTLRILYSVGGSCSESRKYFEDAGTALLSAVNLIELSGIQTRIDLAFFTGYESNEATFPTVCIKNYGERYSLQKISFPMVHTAMFRRIGFKWLETTPTITKDFTGGYGTPLSASLSDEVYKPLCSADTKFISCAWINQHECNVSEILKRLGVI